MEGECIFCWASSNTIGLGITYRQNKFGNKPTLLWNWRDQILHAFVSPFEPLQLGVKHSFKWLANVCRTLLFDTQIRYVHNKFKTFLRLRARINDSKHEQISAKGRVISQRKCPLRKGKYLPLLGRLGSQRMTAVVPILSGQLNYRTQSTAVRSCGYSPPDLTGPLAKWGEPHLWSNGRQQEWCHLS